MYVFTATLSYHLPQGLTAPARKSAVRQLCHWSYTYRMFPIPSHSTIQGSQADHRSPSYYSTSHDCERCVRRRVTLWYGFQITRSLGMSLLGVALVSNGPGQTDVTPEKYRDTLRAHCMDHWDWSPIVNFAHEYFTYLGLSSMYDYCCSFVLNDTPAFSVHHFGSPNRAPAPWQRC